MLQWMGGSRRKVAASRLSTHKRQRQYFQQKKRQQQTAGLDDGINSSRQYQEKPKSLDILSLANLATVAQEHNYDCTHGKPIKEGPEVSASLVDHQFSNSPPSNTRNKDFASSGKAGTKSSNFVLEKIFQTKQSNLETVPSSCNFLDNNGCNLDEQDIKSEHQFSVLDLLGDDATNEHSRQNQVCEAHVAFSVEGLGRIGMEKPVHSPQKPGRASSEGCFSIPHAAKRRHLSKNMSCTLDNFELQLNSMMHDVDEPFAGIKDHSRNSKDTKLTIQGDLMETRGCKADTIFEKDEWLCSNFGSSKAWNDEDFPCKEMLDKASNNLWDDIDSPDDVLRKMRHGISSLDFEYTHIKKKSDICKGVGKFNVLESPAWYMKHFSPERDDDLITSDVERYSTLDQSQTFNPSAWSYCTRENAKDNISLLSEESSSSTAVRSEKAKCSISSSLKVGESMERRGSARSIRANNSRKDMDVDELGYTDKNNIDQRKHSKDSGRCSRVQNQSEPSILHSDQLLRIPKDSELQKNWLVEEGYTSVDIISDLGLFHRYVQSDSASLEWEFHGKDHFSMSTDPKSYSSRPSTSKKSKLDSPVECVLPCSRYYEKSIFTEPASPLRSYNPPIFSSIGLKSQDPRVSHDPKSLGELHSSRITDTQVDKKFPTLSQWANVEDQLGLQTSGCEKFCQEEEEEVSVGNNDLSSETEKTMNGPCHMENSHVLEEVKEETKVLLETQRMRDSLEHTEEISSATKEVSTKHESCVDNMKYPIDNDIPFPSQSKGEGEDESEQEKININSKGDGGSSCTVMLERYILQLLLVQKVSREASDNNSGKTV